MCVYRSRGLASLLAKIEWMESGENNATVIFYFREFKDINIKRQLQMNLSSTQFLGSVIFIWQYNKIVLTDVGFFSAVMSIVNAHHLVDDEDNIYINKFIDTVSEGRKFEKVILPNSSYISLIENQLKPLSDLGLDFYAANCPDSKVSKVFWRKPNNENAGVVIFQFNDVASEPTKQRLHIYLSAMKAFDGVVYFDWERNRLIIADFRFASAVLPALCALNYMTSKLCDELEVQLGHLPMLQIVGANYNGNSLRQMTKVVLMTYIDEVFNSATSIKHLNDIKISILIVFHSQEGLETAFAAKSPSYHSSYRYTNKIGDVMVGINSIINGDFLKFIPSSNEARCLAINRLRRDALDYILWQINEKFFAIDISVRFYCMRTLVVAMNRMMGVSTGESAMSSSSRLFAQQANGRLVGMREALDYNDLLKILLALKVVNDGCYDPDKLMLLQRNAKSPEIDSFVRQLPKVPESAISALPKATSSRTGFRSN